jgi:hypothetical protein
MNIRKALCIVPALLLSAAIGAPNAHASEIIAPTLSTTTGGTVVLGSSVQLTDSALLAGGVGDFPGTLSFILFDPSSADVFSSGASVTGNGSYSPGLGGYTPTVAGTYTWEVSYAANIAVGPDYEYEVVTPAVASPEPGTAALLLAGIALLLVTRKRFAQRLQQAA